jgi:hypothetical protein
MEDPREPVQFDPLRVQHSEKTVEVVEIVCSRRYFTTPTIPLPIDHPLFR